MLITMIDVVDAFNKTKDRAIAGILAAIDEDLAQRPRAWFQGDYITVLQQQRELFRNAASMADICRLNSAFQILDLGSFKFKRGKTEVSIKFLVQEWSTRFSNELYSLSRQLTTQGLGENAQQERIAELEAAGANAMREMAEAMRKKEKYAAEATELKRELKNANETIQNMTLQITQFNSSYGSTSAQDYYRSNTAFFKKIFDGILGPRRCAVVYDLIEKLESGNLSEKEAASHRLALYYLLKNAFLAVIEKEDYIQTNDLLVAVDVGIPSNDVKLDDSASVLDFQRKKSTLRNVAQALRTFFKQVNFLQEEAVAFYGKIAEDIQQPDFATSKEFLYRTLPPARPYLQIAGHQTPMTPRRRSLRNIGEIFSPTPLHQGADAAGSSTAQSTPTRKRRAADQDSGVGSAIRPHHSHH